MWSQFSKSNGNNHFSFRLYAPPKNFLILGIWEARWEANFLLVFFHQRCFLSLSLSTHCPKTMWSKKKWKYYFSSSFFRLSLKKLNFWEFPPACLLPSCFICSLEMKLARRQKLFSSSFLSAVSTFLLLTWLGVSIYSSFVCSLSSLGFQLPFLGNFLFKYQGAMKNVMGM